jgi:ketosteroid isomerase-like protein
MGLWEKSDSVTREWVEAFNEAYAGRHMDRLASFLDDDVRWAISGPVDLMPFCGERRGKQAVLDMVGRVAPRQFAVVSFTPELVLIDGDRASTLCRATGNRVTNGHTIGWRVAQFMRFQDGKILEYCSVIDSFDAAEQVLGHPIELAPGECTAHCEALAV